MHGSTNSSSSRAADVSMAGAILGLGIFLVFSGLVMLERWQSSSERRQSLQLEEVLGGASVAAGALLVIWWLTSALLAVACAGLQKAGHSTAAAAVEKASPAFMRRLALAALGLQLAAGPVAAHADYAPGAPAGISAEQAPTNQSEADTLARFPHWAVAVPEAQEDAAPIQPHWKPTPPLGEPRLLTAPPLRTGPAGAPAASATEVIVLAGDSLWSIAARALGPEASDLDIAREWPRWFEANKAAIGNNPDVLLPGRILQAPGA